MKDLNKIYSILKNGITYLPVSTEYINNMEKKLDIIFPDEFKIFYTKISNGAWLLIVIYRMVLCVFLQSGGIQKCKKDFDFLEWFELWSQRKDYELFNPTL